jgi:hypothetical protein
MFVASFPHRGVQLLLVNSLTSARTLTIPLSRNVRIARILPPSITLAPTWERSGRPR